MRSSSHGIRRIGLPHVPVIQLFSVYVASHRLRGACRRAATVLGDVSFSVCDTGNGNAAADRERLFKPFAQLDTGLTRRHGGTGLGLYISRALAELLGGTIEVESTVGVGSRFTLVLPVDEHIAGDAERRVPRSGVSP